jgi:K+ transporter
MVVVTTKYVCFVIGADNDCEGGIIALLTLASAAVVDPTRAVRVGAWNGSSCPKADRSRAFAAHSAMEWERFCTSADRRLVILSGPQAAFRLRDKAAPTA